jgi:tRNA pseudouridine38-40 synthase
MANVLLLLEFDGTDYHGWQLQSGAPTVQGELEKALAQLYGGPVRATGAGRTDAGVSALAFPVNFRGVRELPLRSVRAALNQALPAAIRVRHAELVPDDFSARYAARSRTYRYTILAGRSPVLRRQVWEVDSELNLELMRAGCRLFPGERDFAPFCRLTGSGRVAVRRAGLLTPRSAISGQRLIQLEVEADRFLYKMVRRMTGSLVDLGRSRFPVAELARALEKGPAVQFSTAPARGLALVRVKYRPGYRSRSRISASSPSG